MGNCFKKNVNLYRQKNWENAILDINSVSTYFTNDEIYKPMKKLKGSSGFPFKSNNGIFIKVVMKNRRNTPFNIMMNLNMLKKYAKNDKYLLLPEKCVETKYAIHFHYPFCEVDMLYYLNNNIMKPNERYKIMYKILDAVEHMHNKGFVHKDIKLDNMVFLNGEPVLCDCDFSTRDNVLSLNKGTREYMAPSTVSECLFYKRRDWSLKIKNQWVDCYALGKTFAKILSVKKQDDINISRLWDKWTDKEQVSLRSFYIEEETFNIKSKWWKVVFCFCKHNEECVFGKRYDSMWTIKKVKEII
jgi:serine/threonine protein kinase